MDRILLFIAFITISFFCHAQGLNNLSDKIYFGGGMGLNLGTNVTNVNVSPQVGYKITDRFSMGLGAMYQYLAFKNSNISLSNYGGSVFARYAITQQIFATTEYEYLTIEFITAADQRERMGFSSYFIGGGYVQPLGRNVSFLVIALYNVLYDPTRISPYMSPLVMRAGFSVGF